MQVRSLVSAIIFALLLTGCRQTTIKEMVNSVYDYTQLAIDKVYNNIPDSVRNRVYTSVEDAAKKPHYVFHINLNSSNLSRLPSGFEQFSELTTLELANNKFDAVPKEITAIKQIKMLDMSNNKVQRVAEEIYNMTNLKSLN